MTTEKPSKHGEGAFVAAYSQVHSRNLPTCSHGSSDKYRLTSQLEKKKAQTVNHSL